MFTMYLFWILLFWFRNILNVDVVIDWQRRFESHVVLE